MQPQTDGMSSDLNLTDALPPSKTISFFTINLKSKDSDRFNFL
jgi:hypothetical protein